MLAGRVIKEESDTVRFTVDLTETSSLYSTYLNGEAGLAPWLGTELAISFSTPTIALGQGTWSTTPPPAIAPADPSPVTVQSTGIVNAGQAIQFVIQSGTPGNTYTISTVVHDNAGRFLTLEIGVTLLGQPVTATASTGPVTPLAIAGGTMIGPLFLFRDPLSGTEAATKNYVDNSIASGFTTNAAITITSGGLQATGNSKITGTLEVTQALTVDAGGIQATGNSKITGTLEVTQALTVDAGGVQATGNSKITGQLEVTNKLTVDTGGITVGAGGLTIAGASSLAGALTVTTGGAAITGNSTITGNLHVTGTTTLDSTLAVTGAATVASLASTGAITSTTLTASGAVTGSNFSGASLSLSGAASAGSVSTSGTVSVGTNLGVSGTAFVAGAITTNANVGVGTTLFVAGTSSLVGTVTTGGTVNVGNGLNVTGAAAINGGGGLTVAASQTIGGTLSVGGGSGTTALAVPAGSINVSGSTTAVTAGIWYTSSGSGPAGPGTFTFGIFSSNSMTSFGFFAASDVRLKTDIETISPEEGERWVSLARPVTYLKRGMPEAGFIAQEQMASGYSQYVAGIPNADLGEYIDQDGNRSVAGVELNLNYSNFIAYHNACLKSLLTRVAQLEARESWLDKLKRFWYHYSSRS